MYMEDIRSFCGNHWSTGPMTPISFSEGLKHFGLEGYPVGFDIETYSPNGFPYDTRDPIVNCSLAMPLRHGIAVVSLICDPCFERDLLLSLERLLCSLNASTLLTYNGTDFDVRYAVDRGKIADVHLDKAFKQLRHIDLYRLSRRLDLPLSRYDQKSVEQFIGIRRTMSGISGSNYHIAFDDFLGNGDLRAVFYNIEDTVGCLRIAHWLSLVGKIETKH